VSRPRVVIAETIAEAAVAALAEQAEVDLAVDVPRAELAGRLPGAEALVVRSATAVDAELIAAGRDLKVIGRAGIGVDNIDLGAATAAGVMVVNAPEANTISAAEHTMALLLAQARRVAEADASLRHGAWERTRLQGVELHGKTLGVLGLGRIGTLVAQRASAFGMRLLAYDPFVSAERAGRIGAGLADLETVLAESDFVTIHLPRTPDTEGLVDAQALAHMKPTARLINVARGGIVNETALAAAVAAGTIAGAAVDVFAVEPTTDSPLFDHPEIVVTPHLGASTQEAQDKAGLAVAVAVLAALGGDLVPSAVNLDVGGGVAEDARPYVDLAERLGRIFAAFSFGLPGQLTIAATGRELADGIAAIGLGALKGALSQVSAEPVSYVNAPILAARRGVSVRHVTDEVAGDYRAALRLTGVVGDVERVIAGTVMAHRGPVLIEVDGYEIEFPIADHMVLLRNSDTPGVIGRVGTALGNAGVNISDMAVGRGPDGAAMMGMSVDQEVGEELLSALLDLDGVAAARYIRLGGTH
jgi:D-3-phosphoglycerate dehydrogenase